MVTRDETSEEMLSAAIVHYSGCCQGHGFNRISIKNVLDNQFARVKIPILEEIAGSFRDQLGVQRAFTEHGTWYCWRRLGFC